MQFVFVFVISLITSSKMALGGAESTKVTRNVQRLEEIKDRICKHTVSILFNQTDLKEKILLRCLNIIVVDQ